jgi:hypothetical protein
LDTSATYRFFDEQLTATSHGDPEP